MINEKILMEMNITLEAAHLCIIQQQQRLQNLQVNGVLKHWMDLLQIH